MTSALTQEEAEERCLANGFEWPKGVIYEGALTKYPVICLICGDNTPKLFGSVGTTGCKKCADRAKMFTHDQVVAQSLAAANPAELLETYRGDRVKHKYRFIDCGHQWEITPKNLLNGVGCGVCHHYQGATYVYLMGKDGVLKVGIDRVEHKKRSHTSRIVQHGRDGFVLVHKEKHRTRAEALAAEKTIIDSRNGGPALKPGEMRNGGEGETFFENQVDVPAIIRMMR